MTKQSAGQPLVEPKGSPSGTTYCDGPHSGVWCRHCVLVDGKPALSADLYAVKQVWFMGDCSDRDLLLVGTLDEAKAYVASHIPNPECGISSDDFEVVHMLTQRRVHFRGVWDV
jgi:hypothetical protein